MPCLYLELTGLEVLERNNGASAHATRLDGNIEAGQQGCVTYAAMYRGEHRPVTSLNPKKKNDPSQVTKKPAFEQT